METLGEKIKSLREEEGLTQIKLAEILFVDKSTIAKYETNKAVPSLEMLLAIADYFKVTTDYLLGRED